MKAAYAEVIFENETRIEVLAHRVGNVPLIGDERKGRYGNIFIFGIVISENRGEFVKQRWASVTMLGGVCLHQFWDDLDRASRSYDSAKKRSREGVL